MAQVKHGLDGDFHKRLNFDLNNRPTKCRTVYDPSSKQHTISS